MLAILIALSLMALVCILTLYSSQPTSHQPTRWWCRRLQPPRHALTPPKPAWVRREVLRLKALLPDHGCRKIAQVFNSLQPTPSRARQTVGKTFVANLLREKQHDVVHLRRRLKHRRPRSVARDVLWALDFTALPGSRGPRTVLGVLDHGTRWPH